MIHLTVFQAFISEFISLFGITVIYRILISSFSIKNIIRDFFIILLITCMPITIGVLYLVVLIIYLWLTDRIQNNPNIITDSIIAMSIAIAISSLFDLVSHYVHTLISGHNITVYGWLIPISKILLIGVLAIVSIYFIFPKVRSLRMNSYNASQLWKLVCLLFGLYICLTIMAENEGVANNYANLLLVVNFSILIVIGTGLINFIKSYAEAQRHQRIIDRYKSQIINTHKVTQQYNEIRRERHDLRNMLLSVQGYIRDHKDKEAEKLLSTFLQNDTTEKHYDEVDRALDKLKISGLHNLVKEKAYKIVEKGIPFSFEINAEINDLPGSEIKTARIIGILMDNAIESVTEQAKPYIQFALLKHSAEVFELVVANSLDRELDINNAMKLNHSNKNGHEGIGLANIMKLVEGDDHYSFAAEVKDKVIIMTCFIQGKWE